MSIKKNDAYILQSSGSSEVGYPCKSINGANVCRVLLKGQETSILTVFFLCIRALKAFLNLHNCVSIYTVLGTTNFYFLCQLLTGSQVTLLLRRTIFCFMFFPVNLRLLRK